MTSQDQLAHWKETVARQLPHLSRPQATVLALWSYGMVLAQTCGLTSVTVVLAHLLGQKEAALRQRLREWCYDAADKRGAKRQLACTLVACWEPGHQERWLVLTDLLPEQAQVTWYGLRVWIEAGFKDCKRGGWHWHQTQMTNPARAERLWLAMAVATLWVVSVGGEADATLPASSLEALQTAPELARPPTTQM
jgi:hypothetical protein